MDNRKIKILHVIKSLGRGGAEMLLPETLKLHDKTRFEFHYIYFLPWKNQMVQSIEDHGGRVTCLTASNNLSMLARVPDVIAYVRRNNINLVHAHLPWAGIVARFVKRITGLPVLYTEHNKQERYHRGTRILNIMTMNWLSAVIAVSDDVSASIKRYKKNLSVPLHTLLNGVNENYFKCNLVETGIRKMLRIKPTEIVVGTVAVFRFQKRLDVWLETAAEVLNKHSGIKFILVGDGPLKEKLITATDELGISEHVHFVGLQKDVRPFLEAMDVYMMTSVFEGLPIALLEAMAFRLPIVTTDAGGIKQVVRNDIEGLVSPVADINKLKENLLKILENKSLRNQFGTNARRRIEENFTLGEMVKNLEQLYEITVVKHRTA